MDLSNSKYQGQMVSVDVCIFAFIDFRLCVLLAKRSQEPYIGQWSLVGGGVYNDETCEQAVQRELKEKLDIAVSNPLLAGVFSQPNRDIRFRNISVSYFCLVNASELTVHTNSKKVSEVKWFDVSFLPHFAFDHKHVLQNAVKLMQQNMFDIAFLKPFLPQVFTLVQLQQAYESALQTTLDKRNFRRKLNALDVLVQTGEKNESDKRKKSAFYQFR